MLELDKIYNTDALSGLKSMDDNSVDCCITSPPYYALRDYGVEGQIGLEDTPEEYISRLVEIFEQVRRVLKKDSTLWVVIGDCYAGSVKGAAQDPENAKLYIKGSNKGTFASKTIIKTPPGYKPKDLYGIPWMLAFATYPTKLIMPMVKAGCPESGVVLDPFMGAGTTALVAKSLDRHFIGFEINPDYVKMAEDRLMDKLGLFK